MKTNIKTKVGMIVLGVVLAVVISAGYMHSFAEAVAPTVNKTHKQARYISNRQEMAARRTQTCVTKAPIVKICRRNRLHINVQLGYNTNKPSNRWTGTPKCGYHTGGIMNVAFGQHFVLQPAILYSLRNTRLQSITTTGNKELLSFNYVEGTPNILLKIDAIPRPL